MTKPFLEARGRTVHYPPLDVFEDGKLKGATFGFPFFEVWENVENPEQCAELLCSFLNLNGFVDFAWHDQTILPPYRAIETAPTDGTEVNALVNGEPARIRHDAGTWYQVKRNGQTACRQCPINPAAIYGWIPFPPEEQQQEAANG